jgi:hypothetical protein
MTAGVAARVGLSLRVHTGRRPAAVNENRGVPGRTLAAQPDPCQRAAVTSWRQNHRERLVKEER